MAYLDKTGLTYFYGKIKGIFATKSEIPSLEGYAKIGDIPTIPSSLPADGGNADTVDGMNIRKGTSGAEGYITFVV